MKFILPTLLVSSLLTPSIVLGQIPCDAEYGTLCPSSSSWEVGTCLTGSTEPVSEECEEYVKPS